MSEQKQIPPPQEQQSFGSVMRYLIVLAVAGIAVYYAYFNNPVEYSAQEAKGSTMATSYSVKVRDFPKSKNVDAWSSVAEKIQRCLDDIDCRMSTFKPDSEVSRFNMSDSTDWFSVSPETAEVAELALDVSRLTDGAFDITVAPLVDCWGFGAKEQSFRQAALPPENEINEIKKRIGFDKLSVRLNPPALKKSVPELSVDLSAIAKGYAVDCVVRLLEQLKFKNYMVEVGGEVRCRGNKGEQGSWVVGIEKPLIVPQGEFPGLWEKKLPMSDSALATSGDYQNYHTVGTVRYSHIIDPRTGYPTEKIAAGETAPAERLGSVSVFDKDCARADALATALFVLGEQKGLEFAERERLPVLFLLRTDGQKPVIREAASTEFKKLFEK
ncbi:MAG: FAD:protein FMN transferase [Planctomycetaceae bacterium]|jgi:thiamine biosynthesis lipoprotein|nr:FAD:protein FMN transferase [Planctomycetaceae bacterium]